MGRTPQTITKKYTSPYFGELVKEVELFTWEKLDYVDKIQSAFGI
jgi:S-adenosylmethionine synthetase